MLRKLLFAALGCFLLLSCEEEPSGGAPEPEARFRIARVSSTIANETPGDFVFIYDDQNRIDVIYDEGRVLADGRIEMWQFNWDNGRLNSLDISAIGTVDTIPVQTFQIRYSGSAVSMVSRVQYSVLNDTISEEELRYTSSLPSFTRLDTGYFLSTQFSNKAQFSIASGLDATRIYENNNVTTRDVNVQLTYSEPATNPIRSLGLPTVFLPNITRMFGLELSQMPEIMFESNLLPSKILILTNGAQTTEIDWTFGYAAVNRVSSMEADDRTIEIEWTRY